MWTMLAGVPGKLKTLLDRLTAERAAKLDHLDADVSTRAPATTALSSAVWTAARAGKLDYLEDLHNHSRQVVGSGFALFMQPPYGGGLPASVGIIAARETGGAGSTTVVDIQGRGFINLLGFSAFRDNVGGLVVSARVRVTIDGVVWESSSLTVPGLSATNESAFALGSADGHGDPIFFSSSLKIEAIIHSSAISGNPYTGSNAKARVVYRCVRLS